MKRKPLTLLTLSMALLTQGCVSENSEPVMSTKKQNVELWPAITSPIAKNDKIENDITQLLNKMTLEQKVAQVIQPEIRDISIEDMRKYGFGSYLNGGGAFPNNDKHATPQDWVVLAEKLYQASVDDSIDGIAIPTMWGTDAVHGHNNVIGATLFPHNIGLGAARNPALLEQIAHATAKEVLATGIDWIFAPTVAVARDDRWGRTYESYSEDPAVVRDYAEAIVKGLQGSPGEGFLSEKNVISTVKHFVGDGGTEKGDDQGDNINNEADLVSIHAQGYVGGLNAGAQSVMASFNSWNGEKIHGHRYLLTDVLKERMGFDGFVVGDWNGHGQIPGCTNENCAQAMNAGLDVYMVPTQAWKPLYENLIAQVKDGTIAQSRLDDAVRRVLRVKMRAGLFNKPSPANRALSGDASVIGHADHRAIAKQAVRESLVLLKNHGNLLPLSSNQHVLVAGEGADNIGMQSGGWTITWQGTGNVNDDFPGATSIYDGIEQTVSANGGKATLSVDGSFTQKPDVAIVVFGEQPYAEGHGDLDNLEYQRGNKKDLALLQSLKSAGIPVVSVFLSGRPLWVNPELNASDAFVAAWLPGSEGEGVAEVLFKDSDDNIQHDFKGKLSFSWPNDPFGEPLNHGDGKAALFPYDFGLTYQSQDTTQYPLQEAFETTEQVSLAGPLYAAKLTPPWSWSAGQDASHTPMSSNTLAIDGLSVRTTDRRIQEDAMAIEWSGEQAQSFGLFAAFPEDWRAFEEAQLALAFDYKVTGNAPKSISVGMECLDGCDTMLEITPQAVGEWTTATLPLACFKAEGMDFSRVMSPFRLVAPVGTKLTISDIKLVETDTNDGCR